MYMTEFAVKQHTDFTLGAFFSKKATFHFSLQSHTLKAEFHVRLYKNLAKT